MNAILHMDLDSFFVSVERLRDARLNGIPLLIGGNSDRGVVASCSYEARAFGIHSAMPMKLAKQLCPEATIISGDSELYSRYSGYVTDIIREEAPLFEKTSIDEFYMDLTGMDRFFGCYRWSFELKQKIAKSVGLPISFGLSTNKTVAKVGTGEAKPNGAIEIEGGREKTFLAPLSIKKIPMVGSQTYRKLSNMGVRKVQTLQNIPVELMERVMGKNGIVLWKKANGIDNTPVVPYSERKSISLERTFDRDTIDMRHLKSVLTAMVENLAFQLRAAHKLTACVTVKIRYSDFNTHTKQVSIPYSSTDHFLIQVVQTTFEKLYQRRMLIRLIGVRFSHLVSGGQQIDLLEDTEEAINLYQAMDKVRKRFGNQALARAVSMDVSGLDRGNPFQGNSSLLSKVQ